MGGEVTVSGGMAMKRLPVFAAVLALAGCLAAPPVGQTARDQY
jgi:hypothetical protein